MKQPYDFETEATALVARMSTDEKASLMSADMSDAFSSVSYTHLTLPTILLV